MKCPYRDFKECLVEQCPSCNYETIETEHIGGNWLHLRSIEKALEEGCAWIEKRKSYEFVSCKLVEGGVQPVPAQKQVINNTKQTSVVIRKSVF